MEIKEFGKTANGRQVRLYTLVNSKGMKMMVMNLGATIVSIMVPDKNGKMRDVVLGYDTVYDYENHDGCFGAVIGRNANRIGGAEITIDRITYKLDNNDNGNNLHSGFNGFNKAIWCAIYSEDCDSEISFWHDSPAGEQGFPGNMKAEVTYKLTDDNKLIIKYEAESDNKTIANFTNHTYFNLNGHDSGNVLGQRVQINAQDYTPVGITTHVPTGEIAVVADTPMDFTTMKSIGRDIESDFEQIECAGGYDHNYVINMKKGTMKLAAKAEALESGITLSVLTDCPGLQLYTGNGISRQTGKNGAIYDSRHGFCFETQYFPDAVNHEKFENPFLLPKVKYTSQTEYDFGLL